LAAHRIGGHDGGVTLMCGDSGNGMGGGSGGSDSSSADQGFLGTCTRKGKMDEKLRPWSGGAEIGKRCGDDSPELRWLVLQEDERHG
jgi:hypothetical protein